MVIEIGEEEKEGKIGMIEGGEGRENKTKSY